MFNFNLKNNSIKSGVLFLFLFIPHLSFSGNLSAPLSLESASVLPKGVGNPQLKSIFTHIESKFSSSGKMEALGSSLNKELLWGDLVQAQNNVKDQNLLIASIANQGFSLSESPGRTVGEVTMAMSIFTPVLAYGVSDKLTLAVAVPIYSVQSRVETGFVRSAQGQQWLNKTYESEPLTAHSAAQKLNNPVAMKASELQYEPIKNQKFTALGDSKLIAKYLFLEDDKKKAAFRFDLTLPTGRKSDVNKLMDIPTGDGQVDMAIYGIYDFNIFSELKWNIYGGYVYQFADTLERRIPIQAGDPLSADREVVSRKLGDQLVFGSGLLFGSSGGLAFGAGYSLQYAHASLYSGSKFSPERYRYLEGLSPSQTLHSLTASLSYATIDLYRDQRFFYPLQLGLTYSYPIIGRNTLSNPLWVADLVLFF